MSEEINKIKEKMIHPKAEYLNIKRVPVETVDIFKKFANDEYVGDYGMALKKLVDAVLVDPQPIDNAISILEDHEGRLSKLEGKDKPIEKKFKTKKMMSGRKIKVPIKEE